MCLECNTNGVELHTHTNVSYDAITPPSQLVEIAKNNGQNAIAITDHFELGGIIEASIAGKEHDVKVIAGVETYIDIAEDFNSVNSTHLTLLGNGVKGFNDLVRLQKIGAVRTVKNTTSETLYKRPPVYIKDVLDNSQNLIVLSGCPFSVFNDTRKFDDSDAHQFYVDFVEKLGDRFYIEIMLFAEDIGDVSLVERIRRGIEHSRKYNLQVVVTCDIHYGDLSHQKVHRNYNQMVGFAYPNDGLYPKKAIENLRIIDHLFNVGDAKGNKLTQVERNILISGVNNQQVIANRLEGVEFDTPIIMPEIENGKEDFLDIVYSEYHRHINSIDLSEYDEDYLEVSEARLERELHVISQMGFETYFLVVHDMHRFVQSVGGKLPNGRGSSGGSFVCYLLGMVALNPITHGLLFERMLNLHRNSAIDIDMDVGEERDQLIEYCAEKYNTIPIVTYSRYGHDSLINDLSSKLLASRNFVWTKKELKAIKGDEVNFKNLPCWKRALEKFPDLDLTYDLLHKNNKGKAKHAAGLVMIQDKTPYEMPITVSKAGEIMCGVTEGGTGAEVTELGYNKLDSLGLIALTHLSRLEKATGDKAPLFTYSDYHESFEMLETGYTDGIFQFSGMAVSDYAKLYKVKSFLDAMNITSLARAGVMASGAHMDILNYRPISGFPKRRSNGVFENGDLIEIVLEDGKHVHIYENWEIKTLNGWKKVKDLGGNDELEIE